MPPQLEGAPVQVVVASFEVVEVEGQWNLLTLGSKPDFELSGMNSDRTATSAIA